VRRRTCSSWGPGTGMGAMVMSGVSRCEERWLFPTFVRDAGGRSSHVFFDILVSAWAK
jgi:hypothetical protein